MSGLSPCGENAGVMDCSPPSWQKRHATKLMTKPAAKTAASVVCTPAATRRWQHIADAATMADDDSRMSPIDTS